MIDRMFITCKPKTYWVFLLAFTGLVVAFVMTYLWENIVFSWWFAGSMLLGIYFFVNSLTSFFLGRKKICLLVIDKKLLVTFCSGYFFKKHRAEIESGKMFSDIYDLGQVENVWIHSAMLNGFPVSHALKLKQHGRSFVIIDPVTKHFQLSEETLNNIFGFIKLHHLMAKFPPPPENKPMVVNLFKEVNAYDDTRQLTPS